MTVECKHGFEEGLCDVCWPAPEPVAKPRTVATTTKARRTATSTALSTARAKSAAAGRPVAVNVGAQRIYHVTHVRNLAGIVESGALLAAAEPVIELSSAEDLEARRAAEIQPDVSVAGHVGFFLSPNATVWNELREGGQGERWSADARAANPTDFVILVSTMSTTSETAVVADGDPAATLTRFASTPESGAGMLRRLRDEEPELLDAEVLVPESFLFESVTLVGVPNEKVRDRVKAIVEEAGYGPKIAVYPPWFQPTPAE